jgi:hypothetical protein
MLSSAVPGVESYKLKPKKAAVSAHTAEVKNRCRSHTNKRKAHRGCLLRRTSCGESPRRPRGGISDDTLEQHPYTVDSPVRPLLSTRKAVVPRHGGMVPFLSHRLWVLVIGTGAVFVVGFVDYGPWWTFFF